MSNFLRKFVKSKSRSKSPVKRPTTNPADHEFELWRMQSRSRSRLPSVTIYQQAPSEPIYATEINPFTAAPYATYQPESLYGLHGSHGSNLHHYASYPSTPTNYRPPPPDPNTLSPYNCPPTPSSTMHRQQLSSSKEYMDGGSGTWNCRSPPFHLHGTGSYNEIPHAEQNGEIHERTPRPRSISPKKSPKEAKEDPKHSPPPHKRSTRSISNTYDYLQTQCKLEGCAAALIVDDSRFWVCKHQLSHASEFFRTLFLNNRALPMQGVQQTSFNEYTVVVSGLRHPPQSTQFKWFIECAVPCPALKDITEENLETCMRLSRRFVAKGLEIRCVKFIQENVENKAPMVALCWLNWALKHRFGKPTQDTCLPVVARLPLTSLEKHRQMITEKLLADLLAMKLRACYSQTANVFQSIHKMDHFHVDVEKCPRCGRHREQGKVRVQASPCLKLIGCERCLRESGCELERKSVGDYQSYYQCEHGLIPFNDRTEDCRCQTGVYKTHYSRIQIDLLNEARDIPPTPTGSYRRKTTSESREP